MVDSWRVGLKDRGNALSSFVMITPSFHLSVTLRDTDNACQIANASPLSSVNLCVYNITHPYVSLLVITRSKQMRH